MVIELLAGTMRRGRDGIAAVEDDMRQTYTVKHIRKGFLSLETVPVECGKCAASEAFGCIPHVRGASVAVVGKTTVAICWFN